MDEQNFTSVRKLLALIIERNVSQETYTWLLDKATQSANKDNNYQFNLTFTSIPRKTGKKEVVAGDADIKNINILIPGFTVQRWTIDKVSRVWLLMNLETTDKDYYITRIENLFPQAEMNELVALYSALPVLAYPRISQYRKSRIKRYQFIHLCLGKQIFNPGNIIIFICSFQIHKQPHTAYLVNGPALNCESRYEYVDIFYVSIFCHHLFFPCLTGNGGKGQIELVIIVFIGGLSCFIEKPGVRFLTYISFNNKGK